ncbi:putative acyltransferase [Terriglobus roseus DSM 18391]|uniref:Putative acyltransferase n=1 Tax=Terriglobus roseus (strain DSM 18391 / NRRL B-41598 / KBS 63) TaxID=926566 RepID=I3ZLA8_TERRK|nr:acyltransferase [Terriglobus roseus]AFL90026.1 putative acyltransferase [Terriglobus roseus DSM 18391]
MTRTLDDSTTGRHIPALDGLRGTAILLVLFDHLFWSNPNPEGSFLVRLIANLRSSTWVGVDLFFVLSGFLLTGILYDTLSSKHYFRNFYGRRTLRIFPLYYAFLFLIIGISYARGYHWFFPGALYYLTYTTSLSMSAVAATNAPWVNVEHFWSLAVEEQFYLAWPLVIYWLKTKRKIATAILIVATSTLLLRLYLQFSGVTAKFPYSIYSWSPSRFDALLIGGLVALAIRSRFRVPVLRWAWLSFLSGASLLVAYGVWYGSFIPLGNAVVGTVGLTVLGLTFASLLAASLNTTSGFAAVFSNPVLRFFGKYSYGLYIYHYSLKSAMDDLLGPPLRSVTHSKLLLVLAHGFIVLAASVLIAVLSYEYFEKAILSLKRYFHDETPSPKLDRDVAAAVEASAVA